MPLHASVKEFPSVAGRTGRTANSIQPNVARQGRGRNRWESDENIYEEIKYARHPANNVICWLCGGDNALVVCDKCSWHAFCLSCDDVYHRHPQRVHHVRKSLEITARPPLPPKFDPATQQGPLRPPRKQKRSFTLFTSRQQQTPTPLKKEYQVMTNLKRFMGVRPLPPTPVDNSSKNSASARVCTSTLPVSRNSSHLLHQSQQTHQNSGQRSECAPALLSSALATLRHSRSHQRSSMYQSPFQHGGVRQAVSMSNLSCPTCLGHGSVWVSHEKLATAACTLNSAGVAGGSAVGGGGGFTPARRRHNAARQAGRFRSHADLRRGGVCGGGCSSASDSDCDSQSLARPGSLLCLPAVAQYANENVDDAAVWMCIYCRSVNDAVQRRCNMCRRSSAADKRQSHPSAAARGASLCQARSSAQRSGPVWRRRRRRLTRNVGLSRSTPGSPAPVVGAADSGSSSPSSDSTQELFSTNNCSEDGRSYGIVGRVRRYFERQATVNQAVLGCSTSHLHVERTETCAVREAVKQSKYRTSNSEDAGLGRVGNGDGSHRRPVGHCLSRQLSLPSQTLGTAVMSSPAAGTGVDLSADDSTAAQLRRTHFEPTTTTTHVAECNSEQHRVDPCSQESTVVLSRPHFPAITTNSVSEDTDLSNSLVDTNRLRLRPILSRIASALGATEFLPAIRRDLKSGSAAETSYNLPALASGNTIDFVGGPNLPLTESANITTSSDVSELSAGGSAALLACPSDRDSADDDSPRTKEFITPPQSPQLSEDELEESEYFCPQIAPVRVDSEVSLVSSNANSNVHQLTAVSETRRRHTHTLRSIMKTGGALGSNRHCKTFVNVHNDQGVNRRTFVIEDDGTSTPIVSIGNPSPNFDVNTVHTDTMGRSVSYANYQRETMELANSQQYAVVTNKNSTSFHTYAPPKDHADCFDVGESRSYFDENMKHTVNTDQSNRVILNENRRDLFGALIKSRLDEYVNTRSSGGEIRASEYASSSSGNFRIVSSDERAHFKRDDTGLRTSNNHERFLGNDMSVDIRALSKEMKSGKPQSPKTNVTYDMPLLSEESNTDPVRDEKIAINSTEGNNCMPIYQSNDLEVLSGAMCAGSHPHSHPEAMNRPPSATGTSELNNEYEGASPGRDKERFNDNGRNDNHQQLEDVYVALSNDVHEDSADNAGEEGNAGNEDIEMLGSKLISQSGGAFSGIIYANCSNDKRETYNQNADALRVKELPHNEKNDDSVQNILTRAMPEHVVHGALGGKVMVDSELMDKVSKALHEEHHVLSRDPLIDSQHKPVGNEDKPAVSVPLQTDVFTINDEHDLVVNAGFGRGLTCQSFDNASEKFVQARHRNVSSESLMSVSRQSGGMIVFTSSDSLSDEHDHVISVQFRPATASSSRDLKSCGRSFLQHHQPTSFSDIWTESLGTDVTASTSESRSLQGVVSNLTVEVENMESPQVSADAPEPSFLNKNVTDSDSDQHSSESGNSLENEAHGQPTDDVVETVKQQIRSGQVLDVEHDSRSRRRIKRHAMFLLEEQQSLTPAAAHTASQLMQMKFSHQDSLNAAEECSSLYAAINFLHQKCELCDGRFSASQMVSMTHCVHRCCSVCAATYFTQIIKERPLCDMRCPFCNEPDLANEEVATGYFSHMDVMLKSLLSEDVYAVFLKKLLDRAIERDPNFTWCPQCSSGFITANNQQKVQCPDCRLISCVLCKKPWMSQHERLSCAEFAAWQRRNDPDYQTAGLKRHLASHDAITCPQCQYRFLLAKGGCMHFTCSMCRYEFCSGCGHAFVLGARCGRSDQCDRLGLHAHHPRNCLFYLRDKSVEQLQSLLRDEDVQFESGDRIMTGVYATPSDATSGADCPGSRDDGVLAQSDREDTTTVMRSCHVTEQKETDQGLCDQPCGRAVVLGHAGLCKMHYTEYLAGLVWQHRLDVLSVYDAGDLCQELRRHGFRPRAQRSTETEHQYLAALKEEILAKIPLEM